MSAPRRVGAESSETRAALLDAAATLMLEEGYAAVTTRRVATAAGANPALVHYYFRTIDGLFLALLRRGTEANLERLRRALAAPQPLRVLWEVYNDQRGTALLMEFVALANHRKSIRAEMAVNAARFREIERDAVARGLAAAGVDPDVVPPEAVTVVMASIGRVLVMEHALGVDSGHAAVTALVEQYLSRVDSDSTTT